MEIAQQVIEQIETPEEALDLLYLIERKFDFTVQTFTPEDIRSCFESGAFEVEVSAEDIERVVAEIVGGKVWIDGYFFSEGSTENLFVECCETARDLGIALDESKS